MATSVYMNIVDCVKGTVMNTGAQKCPLRIEQIIGAILVPKGSYLTAAQMLALKTSIETNTFSSSETTRWYPIQGFVNVEDKSTEAQIETKGYGGMSIGSDGKYYWQFEHDGGLTFHKILSSFHNKQADYDVYFIDGKVWGKGAILGNQKNNDGYLYPFDLEMLLVPTYKIGGQNADKGYIGFQLMNSGDVNNDIAFCPFPPEYRPTSVTGLEHTHLVMTSATLTSLGVATFQWLGETTNLYDRYSSSYSSLVKAYNHSTGALISTTSLTLVPGSGSFTIDLDSNDPDWPASSGGEVRFVISSADLTTASIVGVANCQIVVPRA